MGKRVDLKKVYLMEAAEDIGKEGGSDESVLIGGWQGCWGRGRSVEGVLNGGCRGYWGRMDLTKLYSMESAGCVGKKGLSHEGVVIGGCQGCYGRGWI